MHLDPHALAVESFVLDLEETVMPAADAGGATTLPCAATATFVPTCGLLCN